MCLCVHTHARWARRFQIDNQLPRAEYPVLLYQPPVKARDVGIAGASASALAPEQPPFLNIAFRRLKYRAVGVLAFQSLSFLMQQLDLKVTEGYGDPRPHALETTSNTVWGQAHTGLGLGRRYIMRVVDFVRDIAPKSGKADKLADTSTHLPDPRFAVNLD